jgi:hypothetical protein
VDNAEVNAKIFYDAEQRAFHGGFSGLFGPSIPDNASAAKLGLDWGGNFEPGFSAPYPGSSMHQIAAGQGPRLPHRRAAAIETFIQCDLAVPWGAHGCMHCGHP